MAVRSTEIEHHLMNVHMIARSVNMDDEGNVVFALLLLVRLKTSVPSLDTRMVRSFYSKRQ